jgi:hypothetical protein
LHGEIQIMMNRIEKSVLYRIRSRGRGWSFTRNDFSDLGARSTLGSVIHRLEKKGKIRRILDGLYDYPRFNPLLGEAPLSPDIDQVAQTLARKFGWRIQPSGSLAQNLLGISAQVPARAVYLSDGPNRSYSIGKTKLTFKHTALKETGFKRKESQLLVQALKSLGSTNVTPTVISKIRRWMPKSMWNKVLKDTQTATGWVRAVIQNIAKEQSHE